MTLEEKQSRFVSRIKHDFPKDADTILNNLKSKGFIPLLINSLITTKEKVLATMLPFEDGPFEDTLKISSQYRTDINKLLDSGELYIQNFASSIPVDFLQPHTTENIIDMCAAPGGKSMLIALKTKNTVTITSVENNKNRVYKMKSIFDLYHITSAATLYADAAELPFKYPQYIESFDKVLLDAPCSNEGALNMQDPKSFTYWHPKHPEKLAKLQRRLLHSAYKLLKPGGRLVYSTCTLSQEENEDNARWFENRYKDMQLVAEKRQLPGETFTAFYAVCYTKIVSL